MLGLVVAGVWTWRLTQGGAGLPRGLPDGDVVPELPLTGAVDHRLDWFSPWWSVRIARALRFDAPLGSEHGALVYNAQKFWDMNERRGGHHEGDDLNGIGGMDSDLGDPVFSTADGLVLFAAEPSPGWGKVVVVAHRTADGQTLHAMYAHLDRIDVKPGELVARGGRIGAVGTANGHYPAHLHFEMRASDGVVDIGGGYAMDPCNRLDPSGTVVALRHAAAADLSPSPLARMLGGRASNSP